jgi:metal-responsive CopG/Arc/MetJ family transcriptional regulator
MNTSTRDNAKTRKKRPETTGTLVGVRLQEDFLAKVDAWRGKQPGIPNRPEAIRRLIENALTNDRPAASDASLDRKIAKQETAIAQMHQHSEPSPQTVMAAMDKAVAENDLIDMKNKRTRRKNAKRE